MNERIKQLAEQANELDYETFDEYNHKTVKHYKFNKEKFAELIVADVLDEVLQAMDDGMDVYDTVASKFGVEE